MSQVFNPLCPQLDRSLSIALRNIDKDAYRKQFTELFFFPREIKYLIENREGIEQFVDVGANVGHFSLAAGMLGLNTFAVEALAENFILLNESVSLNKFTKVKPYFAAASSSFDTVSMGGHAAWGEIATDSGQVPSVPLDAILPTFGFDAPDLIKIDVEGHESSVIDGLHDTIINCKPLLVFESNAWAMRENGGAIQLQNKVRTLGYNLYMYLNDGNVTPFEEGDVQHIYCTDYLAIPIDIKKSRATPTIRELSLNERVSMIEQDLGYGEEPHIWHFHQMLRAFRERYGSTDRLDALQAAAERNLTSLLDDKGMLAFRDAKVGDILTLEDGRQQAITSLDRLPNEFARGPNCNKTTTALRVGLGDMGKVVVSLAGRAHISPPI